MTTIWLHGAVNDYKMTTCVQNDYKMIIHMDITHSCFGHDFTHVMLSSLSKLSGITIMTIIVIQNDYKCKCKHSCLKKNSY
jgi:hypothetical protein